MTTKLMRYQISSLTDLCSKLCVNFIKADLLYGSVSQGLGTTKFTNLIG